MTHATALASVDPIFHGFIRPPRRPASVLEQQALAGAERGTVDHDGLRLATWRWGAGAPVLLQAPSVARLATAFCISERTLARRVRAATGQSPLGLIGCVRLNRARVLLETSRMSVDQVAEQVGYGDATALRRLMRKVSGATPRQYRASVSAAA